MITVFTPTYNRGHLLTNIYQSLLKQTSKDFEWVIVDDGSSDNTQEVVKGFIDGRKLSIVYEYQENRGKHFAVNHGVRLAKGELFLILDSDDELPPTAIETIAKCFLPIAAVPSFGGVTGFMSHRNGEMIERKNNFDVLDLSYTDSHYNHHMVGDMAEIFRTSVLKEFPFPEIDGEKFCPEALVWNRISTKYKLRYFNKVVYFRDYLEGGLTDRIVRIRMESPVASMMCYQEMTTYAIPLKEKIKAAINYWRFRLCAKGGEKPKMKWYWNVLMPLGWLMHLKDLKV